MENYVPNNHDVNAGKGLSIVAYLGILVLIPILMNHENNPYVKFHANQGLVLLILELACAVGSWLPFIGFLFTLVSLVSFVFMILGIINAVKGVCRPLPVIGGITLLK